MPDGATFFAIETASETPLGLHERVRRAGWECALVLADEFRDRLTLQQLVAVEINSRRGLDNISLADAGAMVALFVSVVEVRV